MTDEMLALARANAAQAGVENAEFVKGYLEEIPLPDASVDVVISNCVINLAADKARVLREAARVLAPGRSLRGIRRDRRSRTWTRRRAPTWQQWTGCVAGALTRARVRGGARRGRARRRRDPRDPPRARARRVGDRPRPPAVTIRAARPEDAGAVAALYNAGIAERQATFETRPRAAAEIAAWFEPGLPFLVAEDGAGARRGLRAREPLLGSLRLRGRRASTASTSTPRPRGQGHGRRLLDALAAEAERRGMYKLTSRIFTTNAASRAVHRAAGFAEVGVQRRHGRLDGEWKDCVLVERLLGEAAEAAS